MKGVAIYAACIAAALMLFLLAPEIDLWMTGLFFFPGRGFVLGNWPPVVFLYRAIPWIAWAIVLSIVVTAAWLFLMQRPLWRFDRKVLLFIALSTALGPGLLANTVLKDHWGRARPTQIEMFGGTRHFTPAPLPAAQCSRNCSFVSGHAALGFSLVAFAFLLPSGKTRRRWIAAALGFGAIVGLVRIAQGGHFLSDVVWAGLLVFGVTAALHWWIVEKDGLVAPPLIWFYRFAARRTAVAWRSARQAWAAPTTRAVIAVVSTAALVVVLIEFVDRPLALYLHASGPDVHDLFNLIARLGEGWGWLVLFGLAFFVLHWGGEFPRLRSVEQRMRALSAVPAFLFASIASAGLVVDVLKIGFGRMRPKLLFSHNLYGFTWSGWQADFWSFPSGHATTFIALMTALWCIWPQHLLFYVLAGAIVAAARVIGGAHYPSDVLAGALIAILLSRYIALLFARGGIDLAAAKRGEIAGGELPPWPCRRFRELTAGWRRQQDDDPGRSLASAAGGVVSPRHHGAADRDV